jgi:hypothetical protein
LTSSSSVSERLKAVFGAPALPDALFYRFDFALRFDLGGEDGKSGVLRFLQAIDRSRAVVRAVFPRPEDMHVVLARIAPERLTRDDARELRQLRRLGFRRALSSPERLDLGEDGDVWGDGSEILYRYLSAAEPAPGMADIDALLWSSCATDTPVEPRAHFDVFLVDFSRGVAAHVYDERGMDVIATTREPLVEIYRAFGPWLLDYDRARMDATFAA